MPLQRRRDLVGAGGAPLEFPFTNQSTWNVPHNLGYDPHVTLVDSNGKEFKAAIDYVDGLGGGNVFIREGVYSIDDTVIIKENMILSGTGWGTILRNINDTTYLIQLENGSASPNERLIHSSLQNICLDGDKDSNTSGSGIYSEYTQEFNLHNVLFHNFDNDGMYLQTCKKFSISQCLFGGSGKAISGTELRLSTCGDVEIIGNNFHDFSATALIMTAESEKINVVGNGFYSGVDAIKMGTVAGSEEYISIANNNFANCSGYGIVCDTTAVGNNIVDNTFRTIGKNAIGVRGNYWNISGNYVYNPANENIGGDNNIGIRLRDSSQNCIVSNNRVLANNGFMTYAIGSSGTGADYIQWLNNPLLSGFSTTAVRMIGSNSIRQNNHNYNPVGAVGPPSVPATTVNYTNVYGYPCIVVVSGGIVTDIDLDDISTGLTTGSFTIPPSGTINITYSSVPTWKWWGL